MPYYKIILCVENLVKNRNRTPFLITKNCSNFRIRFYNSLCYEIVATEVYVSSISASLDSGEIGQAWELGSLGVSVYYLPIPRFTLYSRCNCT